MDTARLFPPLAARPRRLSPPEVRRQAVALAWAVVLHGVGGMLLLSLLTGAYVTKRALGLDIVPGVDMLPDPEIEAALAALFSLLGG